MRLPRIRRKSNIIDDPAEKARFAEEIRQEFDPVERQKAEEEKLNELILKTHREPTEKEVIEELERQAIRIRKTGWQGPMIACCGAYMYAMCMKARTYPEVALGIRFKLDNLVPPWDLVVLQERHKGKKTGGIL